MITTYKPACSIYWNKNGHHRAVKPTISKPTETVSLSKGTSAAPHDVFPKASCSTSKMPVGLSSPTPSRMRPRYGSQRSSSQLRPPSQLTLAAEREAQIFKRGLSQKSARLGASWWKSPRLVNINDFSDDEEDAPLFDSLASGLSIFGKVKKDDDEARCQSKHSRIAKNNIFITFNHQHDIIHGPNHFSTPNHLQIYRIKTETDIQDSHFQY
ncbi:hypothetical protein BY996DRAFT_2432660 [Phakopsora pachyrhizi]|nr:hypothetical protein BY996DRAFT_2432660 [Phakopsora pachyrhizi]